MSGVRMDASAKRPQIPCNVRGRLTFDEPIPPVMVVVITKRTTKRQFDQMLARVNARERKRRDEALMRLCGRAPLHQDPVEFQRALRDEE